MLGRSPTAGATGKAAMSVEPPSSSGLGHRPFKAAARVRIPLGARWVPARHNAWSCRAAWSARHPVKVEVAGSNPVRTAQFGTGYLACSQRAGASLGQVAQLVRASA